MWEKENRPKGKRKCVKKEKKNGKWRNISWTEERKLEKKKEKNKEKFG